MYYFIDILIYSNQKYLYLYIIKVATQWDAPLYILRSKLILAPVHTSIRSLAAAINEFESQAETILLDDFYKRSSLSHHICESFEDISLFLHVLPLLHLTGFSSPLSLITGNVIIYIYAYIMQYM